MVEASDGSVRRPRREREPIEPPVIQLGTGAPPAPPGAVLPDARLVAGSQSNHSGRFTVIDGQVQTDSVVVASYLTSEAGQSAADYVVPEGADAGEYLQEAFDEAASTGAVVRLLEGVFEVKSPVTPHVGAVLVGVGDGTVVETSYAGSVFDGQLVFSARGLMFDVGATSVLFHNTLNAYVQLHGCVVVVASGGSCGTVARAESCSFSGSTACPLTVTHELVGCAVDLSPVTFQRVHLVERNVFDKVDHELVLGSRAQVGYDALVYRNTFKGAGEGSAVMQQGLAVVAEGGVVPSQRQQFTCVDNDFRGLDVADCLSVPADGGSFTVEGNSFQQVVAESAILVAPTSNSKYTPGGFVGNDGGNPYTVAFIRFAVRPSPAPTYVHLRLRLYASSGSGGCTFSVVGDSTVSKAVAAGQYAWWRVRVKVVPGLLYESCYELALTVNQVSASAGSPSGFAVHNIAVSSRDVLGIFSPDSTLNITEVSV